MNKIVLYIIIIFQFILCNYLYSNNLIFEGASRLSLNDLQTLTTVDIYKADFDEQEIDLIIKELYQSEQIINIKSTNLNDTYKLLIEEAPLIENIYFNGNIIIKDEFFRDLIRSKKSNFINKKIINEDINLIKNIYSNKGFDSTNVNVSTEKFSSNKVNLIFEINEGNKIDISSIKFSGNKYFSSKYLNSIIQSKDKKFYNIFSSDSSIHQSLIENDKNLLSDFYRKKGFEKIDISYSINKSFFNSYILHFYIDENDRFKVAKLDFKLSDAIIKLKDFNKLKEIFENELRSEGNFYDYDKLNKFIVDANNLIYNANLNYEIIYNISSINNEYQIQIFDSIREPKIINAINFYGNTITKSEVLLSKLSIKPGDYFLKSKIDDSIKHLSNYKYINKVTYKNINVDNKTDILFEVDENKKTGNALLGGSFTGDVGLGLIFSIKDYNIFGSGNEIQADISLNSEVALFDITYLQYPFSNPAISNSYTLQNKESDYTSSFGYKLDQKGIGYSLNSKISNKISTTIGLSYNNYRGHSASNDSDLSITDNIGDFDDVLIVFSINQDNTNNTLYPNDGFFNSIGIKFSPDVISDNNYITATYRGDTYIKIQDTQNYFFLSNRYGIADSTNGRLKTINAFSLGGTNFKGFDYRGIGKKTSNNRYLGGNQYFTSTFGYGSSFLFDEKDDIYIKLFYTVGSLWDSDYAEQDFKPRSSLGASFDILTAVGPITFSYAVPIQKSSNDNERRFNFSIGTAF